MQTTQTHLRTRPIGVGQLRAFSAVAAAIAQFEAVTVGVSAEQFEFARAELAN